MDTYSIRALRKEDALPLGKIEQESFSMPWSAEDFAALVAHSYCHYVVAEAAGEVIGCCGYTESCGEGNIDNVVVAPAWRGRGVAQTMLKTLMEQGEAEGITAYTLEVRVSNASAIHVYEKLGFTTEGIRPGFYEKPREDAVIMWRR